jgi:hypothetical protein
LPATPQIVLDLAQLAAPDQPDDSFHSAWDKRTVFASSPMATP